MPGIQLCFGGVDPVHISCSFYGMIRLKMVISLYDMTKYSLLSRGCRCLPKLIQACLGQTEY